MALLHTGDRICASCGGMNGRHRPACSGDESIEVISVYTRQQAIVKCDPPPHYRRQLSCFMRRQYPTPGLCQHVMSNPRTGLEWIACAIFQLQPGLARRPTAVG